MLTLTRIYRVILTFSLRSILVSLKADRPALSFIFTPKYPSATPPVYQAVCSSSDNALSVPANSSR